MVANSLPNMPFYYGTYFPSTLQFDSQPNIRYAGFTLHHSAFPFSNNILQLPCDRTILFLQAAHHYIISRPRRRNPGPRLRKRFQLFFSVVPTSTFAKLSRQEGVLILRLIELACGCKGNTVVVII